MSETLYLKQTANCYADLLQDITVGLKRQNQFVKHKARNLKLKSKLEFLLRPTKFVVKITTGLCNSLARF